jgi:hypothetical protein
MSDPARHQVVDLDPQTGATPAEQFLNNLEPLPVPERRRFWKRLAKLRNALRIRRRKPKADADATKSAAKQSAHRD